ncbi:unnamed protein product [Peniophora sp. CBMAI 1063]|nr:unnamed protein product [Peniophora sp. CBMAI 1063]
MTVTLGSTLSNVFDKRPRPSPGGSAASLPPEKCARATSTPAHRISLSDMPTLEGLAAPSMPPLRPAMRSMDGARPGRLSMSVRIEERPVSVIIVPPRPDTPPALPTRIFKKLSGGFTRPRGVRGPLGSIRR